MKKSLKRNSASGFTLIELLIVIVIIGILAGVLIGVIDPVKQQNRAKDANVKSTLSKSGLAAQAFISAYGHAPDGWEFFSSLSNATDIDAAGASCGTGSNNCIFSVTGNTLAPTCLGANAWSGWGATQCYYRYLQVNAASGQFELYARSWGLVTATSGRTFRFSNYGTGAGEIWVCDVNGGACVAP